MQQLADTITYLKLIFTKRKSATRCSHDCLAFTRRAVIICACKFACLLQVRPRDILCELHKLSYMSGRSCGSHAIKLSSLHGYRAAGVLRHLRAKYVSANERSVCLTPALQHPCVYYGSRASS